MGGIAGQMEPQVTLKYSEEVLSDLWDELDALEALMDDALGEVQEASSQVSDRDEPADRERWRGQRCHI